jgi:hypothetical protein
MSAIVTSVSEVNGSLEVCAELTFGTIGGNITLKFRTMESGDGEYDVIKLMQCKHLFVPSWLAFTACVIKNVQSILVVVQLSYS